MVSGFHWLSLLAVILLIRWIAFEAVIEKGRKNGDEVLFRAPVGLRLLFGFALPGFVYAAGAVIFSKDYKDQWWLSAIFVSFAVLIAIVWPVDIRVSKAAIRKQTWSGFNNIVIPWKDVDYTINDPTDDSIEIVSKAGLKIKHTKYHVDKSGFLREIRKYIRVSEPGHGLE
jgi:hypothetical protein